MLQLACNQAHEMCQHEDRKFSISVATRTCLLVCEVAPHAARLQQLAGTTSGVGGIILAANEGHGLPEGNEDSGAVPGRVPAGDAAARGHS